MKHRFTIKELDTMTDEEILQRLVQERLSTLSQYAPLAARLRKIKLGRYDHYIEPTNKQ